MYLKKNLLGFKEKVIKRICINIYWGWSGWHKTGPLPSIVFGIKQEICAHNGDTHGDNGQNGKDQ